MAYAAPLTWPAGGVRNRCAAVVDHHGQPQQRLGSGPVGAMDREGPAQAAAGGRDAVAMRRQALQVGVAQGARLAEPQPRAGCRYR